MKTIIILGDGMADYPIEQLNGKTPLQYAETPYMDMLARTGRTGRLVTVPDGYTPGSEVANTAILGYDLDVVYEGRGPLEAASIGYEMDPLDLALRCNIISVRSDGTIKTHNGGNLTTEESTPLVTYLNENLGSDKVKFVRGIQYRHLLIIKGGSKYIECAPPHDHPNEEWAPLLVKPKHGMENYKEEGRLTPQETADLVNDLIIRSKELLEKHPFNIQRQEEGKDLANIIWPWSGGYRPAMQTLSEIYPNIKSGAVISAVDLIRGIGHYAGLDIIKVDGATGLWDTNYEGKTAAAIEQLKHKDFVFLHVEASDEAGHDGEVMLKVKTIENLDSRMIGPIVEATKQWNEPVCIAVLPDHYTPVEKRIHIGEPVPFIINAPGLDPDSVQTYDEYSCVNGGYGILRLSEFMQELNKIK
ncbi:MAG: cofactor-independent phosphoglycerate mutase [Prevotellaceae bacterium]|nr:cofactor-independent phosphoglycerate mutase [Prevotellaceae bacterium]